MDNTTVVGLDIAKTVFHVCVMSSGGKVLERKRLYREEVLEYFSQRERSIVALESCGGSSYWARELEKLGFKVRLISSQFVKPFVKSQKNDAIDAEAICEAALRPQMRFVTPNTLEQQDLQNVHRVRERIVKERTKLSNQIRGLLLEYGVAIPKKVSRLTEALSRLVDELPDKERDLWREVFLDLRDDLIRVNEKVARYDKLIQRISRAHAVCKRLEQIPGVGPVTSTAIIAAAGKPQDFKNGRQFAAWLGLVPQQESTGGKPKLLGITKKGNRYLRKLLVHGARTEVNLAKRHGNEWLLEA